MISSNRLLGVAVFCEYSCEQDNYRWADRPIDFSIMPQGPYQAMALWYRQTQKPVTHTPSFVIHRDQPTGNLIYFGLSEMQRSDRYGWYRFNMHLGEDWRQKLGNYPEYQTLLLLKI